MQHPPAIRFLSALSIASLMAGAVVHAANTPPARDSLPGKFSKADWEPLSDDDGVNVARWEVPGSDLFAFKAVTEMDVPFARVASVIFDHTRAKGWTPDLEEVKIIRRVSDTSRVQYIHIGTPFVIKDRDFVVKANVEWLDETRELLIYFRSVEDPEAPLTDYVRGDIKASYYILKPLDRGKRVHVTFLADVDPKGTVPRWLVNAFQKSFPRKTLVGLREEARKPDVKIHPGLIPVLKETGLDDGKAAPSI